MDKIFSILEYLTQLRDLIKYRSMIGGYQIYTAEQTFSSVLRYA